MILNAKTIPHKEHRYPTTGDYWEEGGVGQIRVSEMESEDYEFLIMIHELVEGHLCKKRGVAVETVRAWDMAYQGDGEPGSAAGSPYKKEHFFAEAVERMVASALRVDWDNYEEAINKLWEAAE